MFILIAVSAIFLLPLIWMISTSLKTNDETYTWPPVLIPSVIKLSNYPEAWSYPKYACSSSGQRIRCSSHFG